MTELQKTEIAMFERKIVDAFIPKEFQSIVLRQRSIKKKFDKFEDFVIGYMNDDGFIDGEKLNDFLEDNYPNALKYVSVPDEPFKLDEILNEVMGLISSGGIL